MRHIKLCVTHAVITKEPVPQLSHSGEARYIEVWAHEDLTFRLRIGTCRASALEEFGRPVTYASRITDLTPEDFTNHGRIVLWLRDEPYGVYEKVLDILTKIGARLGTITEMLESL